MGQDLQKGILLLSLLLGGLLVGPWSCSGQGSMGGPPGGPVALNAGAPTQISGAPTPAPDWDPGADANYRVAFEKDDLSSVQVSRNEWLVNLKGTIEKTRPEAVDMAGRSLEIIDRRIKQFLLAPVVVKDGVSFLATFSVTLKIPALTYEELMTGEPLSFYLSPDTPGLKSQEGMTPCDVDKPWCIESDWMTVSIKNKTPPPEKKTDSKDNPTPPAPGSPPPLQGSKTGGDNPICLHIPGTGHTECSCPAGKKMVDGKCVED